MIKNKISGWLVLDKTKGISSAKALNAVKKLLPKKKGEKIKVGHAGTLDPFATGLLLVAIGEATKLSEYAMSNEKEYIFTMVWGEETNTLDPEGEVIKQSNVMPNSSEIEAVLPNFIGNIKQAPPAFSAIKISGKRSYDLARKGEEIELPARNVECHSLKIISHNNNATEILVKCGKGFYIRSLARDIAYKLNSCAYVSELRRTKIGQFTVNEAVIAEDLSAEVLVENLHPIDKVLNIKKFNITLEESNRLSNGLTINTTESLVNNEIIATIHDDNLVALCEFNNGILKPKRVFKDR